MACSPATPPCGWSERFSVSLPGGVERVGARVQTLEEVRRGRDEQAAVGRAPVDPGHPGAGLLGDQCAGGVIPGVEATLEVRIQPPGGHRAEVEGCGADAADVAHVPDQLADEPG